jgi:hypothetical protein
MVFKLLVLCVFIWTRLIIIPLEPYPCMGDSYTIIKLSTLYRVVIECYSMLLLLFQFVSCHAVVGVVVCLFYVKLSGPVRRREEEKEEKKECLL